MWRGVDEIACKKTILGRSIREGSRIVWRWDGSGPDEKPAYKTRIEMNFEPLDDGGTFVTIAEEGWRETETGRKRSYINCEGWSQMLACMKAYVEHGINLRDGYYRSEMRGEPANPDNI